MLNAVIIGIVAWVFCMILMEEGMIFSKWWNVLNKLPNWLAKPLGSCEYCFAGQIALWYYFYQAWLTEYNLAFHVAFISVAIFTIETINTLIKYKE